MWWRCGGGVVVVVWFDFFVIIIPTPVWVFDLDFDWGVAKKEERLNDGDNNGKAMHGGCGCLYRTTC